MVEKEAPGIDIIIKKIGEVSFFATFRDDVEVMHKIASMTRPRTFKKGKTIINEGDYGDELFILLSGAIDILKKTLQNERYLVTTLNADMGGINVGELALIDNDQRSASVVAKTDCETLVICRDDFNRFGNENPAIGLEVTRALARQLSAKLRKTNADVITLFSALVEEISEGE